MGARRTVRCASTEPAKPCNLATTHTLSRTLDRNTTKRTPQRHATRHAVHEEASNGAESAPLGVKDNTIKPRACEDGSSSRKCPMVAMGLASRSNWVKRTPSALRRRAQAIPSLHGSPTTHRNYKGHRGTLLLLLLPSSLPLSSPPPPPLLPRNRVVRKTHTSPIVARNLLRAAMGETNTVRVAIACPS